MTQAEIDRGRAVISRKSSDQWAYRNARGPQIRGSNPDDPVYFTVDGLPRAVFALRDAEFACAARPPLPVALDEVERLMNALADAERRGSDACLDWSAANDRLQIRIDRAVEILEGLMIQASDVPAKHFMQWAERARNILIGNTDDGSDGQID